MKIRIAYHRENDLQMFDKILEMLKPWTKSVKYLKNPKKSDSGYKVAFLILNSSKTL